jgi:hypothetical protein
VAILRVAREIVSDVSDALGAVPLARPFASLQEQTIERVQQFQLLFAQMAA